MFRTFLCIFIICFCVHINELSAQGRKSCQTPDNKNGICININNCTTLLNLLLTQSNNPQAREFLRTSVCEYDGQLPIVCCPTPRSVETTTPQTINTKKLPKSPNCGLSNMTTPRVVNGVPAKLGEFPWIVALGYRNDKNPDLPKWLCGGSLITDKHILTAAHCVHNRQDLYTVRLGDLDLYSDDDGASPVTIPIAKVKIHEDFNITKFTNDIAILTLKKTPNNPTVWPICLPVAEPYRSMTYLNFSPTLAGWGAVTFAGPSSSILNQIFVPVLRNQECARVFSQRSVIDEKIICAGSTNGDKDACGGDSGGPLMNILNEGKNYRVYQIGIVSYGFKCAEPGYPGVYTRVTAFIDWIEKNLN